MDHKVTLYRNESGFDELSRSRWSKRITDLAYPTRITLVVSLAFTSSSIRLLTYGWHLETQYCHLLFDLVPCLRGFEVLIGVYGGSEITKR